MSASMQILNIIMLVLFNIFNVQENYILMQKKHDFIFVTGKQQFEHMLCYEVSNFTL